MSAAAAEKLDPGFSRLTLGTVQLGLPYGIANQTGQPDYQTCVEIVAAALEGGIRAFDTAAAYGNSEEVLGQALAELGATETVRIMTKCMPIGAAVANLSQACQLVEESVCRSLKNLRRDRLDVVLLHRESELLWVEALWRLKERGLVDRVGLSVDSNAGAAAVALHERVEVIQWAHNLLDRRMLQAGFFPSFRERGGLLFGRSVFLQGLLIMPEERIPSSLAVVVPMRRRLEALAAEAGMDMTEFCLRYSLSFRELTSVLIGAETPAQVRRNVAMASRGPLADDVVRKVIDFVPDLPESVLRPSQWSKLA